MVRLRSRIALLLGLAVLFAGTMVGSPARADRKAEAAQASDRADRAFAKGEHQAALTDYEASFAKYPKPFLLFRIAECQRLLGKDAEALATYQRYLGKVGKGADRKRALAYVAELGPKVAAATPTPEPEPEPAPTPVAQSTDTEAPPMSAAEVARLREQERKRKPAGPVITTSTAPKNDQLPPGYDPANLVVDPADPQPVVAEARPEGRTPVYKKWWLWTAIGGVVVVGVGVGVGLAFGLPKFTSELPPGGPGASSLTVGF